jgi:hypothetical protein
MGHLLVYSSTCHPSFGARDVAAWSALHLWVAVVG